MIGKFKFLFCFFGTFHLAECIVRTDSCDSVANASQDLWQCTEPMNEDENLVEMTQGMFSCAKKNLFSTLVSGMDSDCLDVGDGVTFTRQTTDPSFKRTNFPDGDSASFRSLLDEYSDFLSRRSARWDLGFMYPGLVMRIGPTMTGSGYLEFGLEKRLDYHERAKLGPGQMIVRRTILPHLLNFRMSLANLLPLILGLGLIVAKNAYIFSKVTFAIFTLLAFKSFILFQAFKNPEYNTNHHFHHRPTELNVQTSVPHDPVNFDDDLSVMTVNRPRPQGYSIPESIAGTLLTRIVKKLSPQQNANKNLSPKPLRYSGKRNFSWERKK